MLEIANDSITQAIRLVKSYPANPLIQQLGEGFSTMTDSLTLTAGVVTLPTYILDVTSVIKAGDRAYTRVPQEEFFEIDSESSEPRSGMWIYTVMYDYDTLARRIYCRQGAIAPSDTITFTAIYTKSDYVAGDTAVELFIQGLDDFLLNLAEREARDREHNWERSQILDVRIALSLGQSLKQGKT